MGATEDTESTENKRRKLKRSPSECDSIPFNLRVLRGQITMNTQYAPYGLLQPAASLGHAASMMKLPP